MTSTEEPPDVQPRPVPTTLSNGYDFTIALGLWCPDCGDDIRSCDAEALDVHAVRLVCRCGQLILQVAPRARA
jgi:hypothetical protein